MWSLYENEKKLEPLIFSNGKNQEDIVNEIIGEIKKGTKLIFIKGVCGTGKCLDKDSLVFCKPLGKKYFGNYKISEIMGKEGRIFSLDDSGNIIETKFKNVRQTGKKSLFKLLTRTGREITVSENHPFLTITKEGLEWKPLRELRNSQYICMPNLIKINPTTSLEDNKIKILAHLITEGKCGDKTGSPKYYQDKILNFEIRKDYENALQNLFPDGIIRNKSQKEVTIIFNNRDTRFGTTNKLRLFIREFGLDGGKSKDKFVPEIIFNLDKKKIALFLKIMFSCDGSIYVKELRNKEKQIIIDYSTISYRLIKDMSLLLNQFGIHHTITSKGFKKNKKYSWRISISNKLNIKKFIEEIGFIGKKQDLALQLIKEIKPEKYTNIDKIPRVIRDYLKNKGYNYNQLDRYLNYEEIENFRKNIGFKQIRKQKLAYSPCVFKQGKIDFLRTHLRKVNEYINDDIISFICNKDIIWDKVNNIEYLKDDETYDLEVPEHHNFIADGIIVHNSAIALNLAKELGRASIVVPIKNLQRQYEHDYSSKKYVLKANGEKLKIRLIKGRQNFPCPYSGSSMKIEKNSTLGIFETTKSFSRKTDDSCDSSFLPCKIEIKEKNSEILREYLKQNRNIKNKDLNIKEIRRLSIASACPYWGPVVPSELDYNFKDAKPLSYKGLNNKEYKIYNREEGCGYYNQYNAYVDSDVIIFNSDKYKIETLMNRKPLTDIEIIDECDEFLDSFSESGIISLNRFAFALGGVFAEKEGINMLLKDIAYLISKIDTKEFEGKEMIPLKNTPVLDLIKAFVENELMDYVECDEDNYCYHVDEVARTFYDFADETFLFFEKRDRDFIIKLVTVDLSKRFKEMINKNKAFVLMSGTIHSENVLRDVFGLDNFKVIEAETDIPGKISFLRTGLEINCNYNSRHNPNFRKNYLLSLKKCIEQSAKPILVHVISFSDLPDEKENKEMGLGITTREELAEQQKHSEESIRKFKAGETDILYTTRCNRGMDFPGDSCKSIILTKFPYPDVSSPFWKLLKKVRPEYYSEFYLDKARRELLQRVYRGLRSKDDHIFLLSPDIRIFQHAEKL